MGFTEDLGGAYIATNHTGIAKLTADAFGYKTIVDVAEVGGV